MNELEQSLHRIATFFDDRGTSWALVGGFAVSARVEPRFTRDIDLAVAVADDVSAEATLRDLMAGGYQLFATVEQEAVDRLATARLLDAREPQHENVVDLLFASSGIEPEITAEAERLEILPGLVLPVARLGHLIAVKLLARDDETRPQDIADLRAMLREATGADIALAETAVELITERGYHRERDLKAALSDLVEVRKPG
ncbi:nucleotidyl transferase AbiEii/AbiGii toxin family protein [Glycomyces sp. NPDC021274]|uniref:nucleotidyl transferase AbiEii/AbiGii toxin family protein n=1 Tax=Glycomyces sp. NPDC021274 TaxID=3155120 RepID=UPI0033C822C6